MKGNLTGNLTGTIQMGPTQDAPLTSTPVHNSSKDFLSNISETKPLELESSKFTNQLETSEGDSTCCQSKSKRKHGLTHASLPRKLGNRVGKDQMQTRSKTKSTPAKRRRGRTRSVETENSKKKTTSHSATHSRLSFELENPDAAEQESVLSSDLSIELSHHEEPLPSLSCEDDDIQEDDEELPTFLMQVDKKPPAITGGAFVWHKYKRYPFWPAWVKSVNRKQKKASIIFIDDPLIHEKKGFAVTLKTLKPFGSEEHHELVCKSKEKYDAAIEWCLELISDYRIKIACGTFSGSFIEYFAHDMSYPVRRKYPKAASERLTISSESTDVIKVPCEDDSFSEQHGEVSTSLKRLLPDRSHAAHNRANEKLVHFIVKQRMVEGHLLSVISGKQPSRWLRSFLSASRRRVVNVYLEDDQQLDQVYGYLKDLYTTAGATAPCLPEMESMQLVSFVLDVLLPEAIIYAIAGLDNVPVKKAEEKYIKGRCISKREKQEFDLMIERHMTKKFQCPRASPALLDDPFS
ncbi:PWWP domain-containing DNA repair factor 3B-like isoform X2 [Eleginops maclovinus]|uniref:PWWP domain-containing DNA repair factor 3B-like isoform X2 n=1 Tax=Eleginops maclovinus TaxID=56733 RepID=UPI003080F98A